MVRFHWGHSRILNPERRKQARLTTYIDSVGGPWDTYPLAKGFKARRWGGHAWIVLHRLPTHWVVLRGSK